MWASTAQAPGGGYLSSRAALLLLLLAAVRAAGDSRLHHRATGGTTWRLYDEGFAAAQLPNLRPAFTADDSGQANGFPARVWGTSLEGGALWERLGWFTSHLTLRRPRPSPPERQTFWWGFREIPRPRNPIEGTAFLPPALSRAASSVTTPFVCASICQR